MNLHPILLSAALAAVSASAADVSVAVGRAFQRPAVPESLSGITYVGGNRFWAVADDGTGAEGGLYECTIDLGPEGTNVASFSICSTNERVRLGSASDLEGCAYDPATGWVWATDEGGRNVRAYDPATGAQVGGVHVPYILTTHPGNFGFEALSMRGDGLALWTCNEEALVGDGSRSSHAAGTTIRLAKYSRRSARDEFALEAMYPYTTDAWTYPYDYKGKARLGVAGLCALPDGSLLVLERELSFGSTSILAMIANHRLGWRVYRVARPEDATDVKGYDSLKDGATWTGTEKSLLAEGGGLILGGGNFEGICLGPRLANGDLSVLLLSDAGDGISFELIQPLVLSGLDVHTLDFPEPDASLGADAAASLVGSNYRLLAGTRVESTLSGSAASAARYAADGSSVPVPEWSLASGAASGEGAVASFDVAGDDTLLWTGLSAARPVETFVIGQDTFEEYAAGAGVAAGALAGWAGSGAVEAGTPGVGVAGRPMSSATHGRILELSGGTAVRTYAPPADGNQKLELLLRVAPGATVGLYDAAGDWFATLGVEDGGSLLLGHGTAEGGLTRGVLDASPFSAGDWIRLGFLLDRETNPDGPALLEVSVDGTPRASEHGLLSPAAPVVPADGSGTWHYARPGGAAGIVSLKVAGSTAVDDVLLAEADFPTESAPGYVRADGVPSDWIRARGLEPVFEDLSAPTAIRDGDRVYTLGDAFTAGVDPDGTDPLRETEVELLPDGRVRIVLNGVRPDNAAAYAVYGATCLSDLSTDDDSLVIEGAFRPDSAAGRTVWTSAEPVGDAAFFRVKASR